MGRNEMRFECLVNSITKHRYRGINVLVLGIDQRAFETGDPRWMTYQQAQEKGWQVKKGERVWSILHLTITTMRHSRDGRGTKMQMKLALSDAELLALEAQI